VQKKNDVVICKPSVALRHFFANENLDSRIKSVDLHVIFDNNRLLSNGRSSADKYSQQRNG
jgi:hypothetical protein